MLVKKALVGALCLIAIVAVLGRTSTEASVIKQGDYLRIYDGPGTGNGGEFKVRFGSSNPNNTGWGNIPFAFHTFCCELSEDIALGNTTYRVAGISMNTMITEPKALSKGAAWLFQSFWDNTNRGLASVGSATVGGLSYALEGTTRNNDARAVQLAIWHMMGWIDSNFTGQSGSTYEKNKAAQLVANASAQFGGAHLSAASANETRVRIINIQNLDGTNRQDQLVVIPEPGSILVWGVLALASVGLNNRRRKITI